MSNAGNCSSQVSLSALQESARRRGLSSQWELSRLSERKCAQIIHQSLELLSLEIHRFEALWGGLEDAVAQRLDISRHDGQRGAQFVRDIGGHLHA
jgi:hypothetical protein